MALSPSSTTAHKAMAAACRMVLCLDVFCIQHRVPLSGEPSFDSSPMEVQASQAINAPLFLKRRYLRKAHSQ